MRGATAARAAIGAAGLDATSVVSFCTQVHAAVDLAVPSDRWCGFALDPATLFPTNGVHEHGLPPELIPRLLEIEYGVDDVNTMPALAQTTSGVGTIARSTGGDPARSARWRDTIAPAGLAHEARAVFRDGGVAWGALILLRDGRSADFDDDELDFLAGVAPAVARGYRRVLVRQQLEHGDDAREAGLVVLDGTTLEIRSATSAALHWLEELDDGGFGCTPTPIVSVAQAAQAGVDGPALVRTRTRGGRWLSVTAEVLAVGGRRAGDVGLVLQPSRPAEIALIVSAAHGLTPRESEVVRLVARGCTNDEIARALAISRYTVADHLKNVFSKLDVTTRGELTSKLYFDHYLPRSMRDEPAGSDGWFLSPTA